MKLYSFLSAITLYLFIGACATSPDASHEPSNVRAKTASAPGWVKKIPDRMAEILVERHLCKDGPAWGAARRDPTGQLYGDLAFEEIGSAGYCGIVEKYNLWDKVPPLTDELKKKSLAYWQSWQDAKTGVFKDPRDPDRLVGEKYVVNLIRFFGGEPLYPQKETKTMLARDESGKIDTTVFLDRTQNDPDWANGGWGAGSHTGYIAVQLLEAINEGHTELIPDLEKGLENILSHQDPATGLWGPPGANLDQRLGGTLKVITRLYFTMGVNVPYAEQLADSLIKHEKNGDWYRVGQSFCVPQNVILMVSFCLEACEYRREDLLGVFKSKVKEYTEWILPDGTMLLRRGDSSSACVENVHLTSLGVISGYLRWEDSPFKSPIDMEKTRKLWESYRYRPVVQKDGSVKVVDTYKEKSKSKKGNPPPVVQTCPADVLADNQQLLERVRRQKPAKTPARFNDILDRLADILVEKHLYKNDEYWGLARAVPNEGLPYDELGSARFVGLVNQYNLFDRVGKLDGAMREKTLHYWQSWQDPKTHRFKDPRNPDRLVNEKYVVGLIHGLGGEPLYPWTTTSESGKIETKIFLDRTLNDPDWEKGGWGVGSHTGFQALEIFDAINDGQTELIDDLERGIEQIFTHQDPTDGLWGPPSAGLMWRIGGTLKIVGRLYFRLGMQVPHTRALADSLIEHSRNGDWYSNGQNSCVPRNVAEVTAYCIEVSDYRRAELLDILDKLAKDYESWVLPDGRMLTNRGDSDSVGLEFTTMYALGLIGAYLHWEDCRLPNPLAEMRRGQGYRYRIDLQSDDSVKIVDTGQK